MKIIISPEYQPIIDKAMELRDAIDIAGADILSLKDELEALYKQYGWLWVACVVIDYPGAFGSAQIDEFHIGPNKDIEMKPIEIEENNFLMGIQKV